MQRARELDKALESTGKPVGPLHGLPIPIKVRKWPCYGNCAEVTVSGYVLDERPENDDGLHGMER